MNFYKLLFLLPLFLFSSCFLGGKLQNSGKVMGYSPGKVLTEKSSYEVGLLPAGWNRVHIPPYRTISFYNKKYRSTIETDAFCDESYDDASLKVLTTHLQFALTDKKVRLEKTFTLDQRGAYRSVVDGKVDGVLILLDTVVVKKDNCLFDFSLVAPPYHYENASDDFEIFFRGFKYQGGEP